MEFVMEISDDSSCSDRNNTILSTNSPFPEDLIKNVSIFILKKHTKFERIIARAEKDFFGFLLNSRQIFKKFFSKDENIRKLIFQGTGNGCEKCICFAEVFKQKIKQPIFQWNVLRKNQNNKSSENEKERNLITPEMFILISKDPFPDEYQCLSQQTKKLNEDNVVNPEFDLKDLEENQRKRQVGKQFLKQNRNKKANRWRRPDKIAKKNVKK
uniref:Uncharacterized protein n=3 Tax=Meloidogyne TaxID=189290 RepID=A0A6V7YC57_MELEN|nr:unnamed protein product [Meloidogyne enterolobii]